MHATYCIVKNALYSYACMYSYACKRINKQTNKLMNMYFAFMSLELDEAYLGA